MKERSIQIWNVHVLCMTCILQAHIYMNFPLPALALWDVANLLLFLYAVTSVLCLCLCLSLSLSQFTPSTSPPTPLSSFSLFPFFSLDFLALHGPK